MTKPSLADFAVTTLDGQPLNLADLTGRVLLIVNTASECGFTPQYDGNPPGLPDVVMMTDNGIIPPMRTPSDIELVAVHGELHFQVAGGIEMYTSKIFAGQLMVEYHTHGPEPERSIAAVEQLLIELADAAVASSVG